MPGWVFCYCSSSPVSRSEIRFPKYTPPTKRQKSFALSARVPSFERDRPPGGPPLVTPQLNGGPARRAVKNCTTRAKPNLGPFDLEIWIFEKSLLVRQAQWRFSRRFRALWRRGRKTCSPASPRVVPRHTPVWARGVGARGEVFFSASRHGRGREARRAMARRRAIGSPARCLARARWANALGREVFSPTSWRCVPRRVSACQMARWPADPELLGACRRG